MCQIDLPDTLKTNFKLTFNLVYTAPTTVHISVARIRRTLGFLSVADTS